MLHVQARLLGLSGLLPAELARTNLLADHYLKRIWDHWWRERSSFEDVTLPRSAWRLDGLRPANHPARRLALASHWLAEGGWPSRFEQWLTQDAPGNRLPGSLLAKLQIEKDEFWSWHWTFRGARLRKAQPLLGLSRATDLAMNVILPWLWVRATTGQQEAARLRIEQRYFSWPAAQDNASLRRARLRLMGAQPIPLPRTAAIQQGLLQIMRDFCDHSDALCQDCRLPALVKSVRAPTPASGANKPGDAPAAGGNSERAPAP